MVYGNCQVEREVSDGRSQKAPNHSPSVFPYRNHHHAHRGGIRRKLRVAYTAFAGTFTILWVGHETGLYRKPGVELELLLHRFEYESSSGFARRATSTLCILRQARSSMPISRGADLVMIGCQYDQGQTSFFTTASITNISGLKGKTLGVSRFGSFSDFVARYVLRKNRLQPVKDVAILQVGGTQEIIAAMWKNLVQGGSISPPFTECQATRF